MKNVLILQFRIQKKTIEDEQRAFSKVLGRLPSTVTFQNAVLDTLDWSRPSDMLNNFDALILGGSGEFDFDGGRDTDDEICKESCSIVERMAIFLEYLEVYDFPTLAICFGHQILGKSKGISVINDITQAKVGSHYVELTLDAESDPLFKKIPKTFVAQYGHKDSLSALPEGAVLLGKGDQCLYSALRFGNNRYSVQFHPELDAENIRQKCILYPDYLPKGLHMETAIEESPHATQILTNFINFVVQEKV